MFGIGRKPPAPPPAPEPMSLVPSDYLDADTALVAILVSLLVLYPPKIEGKLLLWGAGGYGAWMAAAASGYQADGAAVVASMLILRAIFRAYQIGLTLLATFPLTITFPYVVDILPRFAIKKANFFNADGATPEVAAKRKAALEGLQKRWSSKYSQCLEFGAQLKTLISDVRFTSGRCFPPFNEVTNQYLDPSMALKETRGSSVVDIDGNEALDISGSYGVNVCGYEKYKEFITAGWKAAKDKGLYLGSLDEITLENIKMIKQISGLDEVSFHMSGTEAVMAAVRCARFNKRKPLVVTFGGAYHGWWDGMQPAAGNERTPGDVLCLKDMNALSLAVIKARSDEIAGVLVNPLQCFHLNASPPSDLVLSSNNRKVGPTAGYKEWLHALRKTCDDAGVLLIFDEVCAPPLLWPPVAPFLGCTAARSIRSPVLHTAPSCTQPHPAHSPVLHTLPSCTHYRPAHITVLHTPHPPTLGLSARRLERTHAHRCTLASAWHQRERRRRTT